MPSKCKENADAAEGMNGRARLVLNLRGAVQGIGFRPFVFNLAESLRLTGFVQNNPQGVRIEAEGPRAFLLAFQKKLLHEKPLHARYYGFESYYLDPSGARSFEIKKSAESGDRSAYLMPDIAVCPECIAEIRNPRDRRYRYPFTNCTHCGPRFTLIESLPYDRANTSMKDFEMCEACRREYEDPRDRRFHAQPNACPDCGPALELSDTAGKALAVKDDALRQAAEQLAAGKVAAVKGLGGFHLMADALNPEAVRKLRQIKGRERKPFAVMFPDLATVREFSVVGEREAELLMSPQAPIVFLEALRDEKARGLLHEVAPRHPYLGVMLPYTPLHHLLLAEVQRPLVATSANYSDEMIATSEEEVFERFKHKVDLFLVHDRGIVRHADDSIVRVMAGRELVLRRSRGYPWKVHESKANGQTAIAVGGHLKNTVAAVKGGDVYLSQHIGDLDNPETLRGFEGVIADMKTIYAMKEEQIAADSHPEYLSTRFAKEKKRETVDVQHHYAHALACMAENEIEAPVFAAVWDGTGLGPDGTLWGGEFLSVDERGFTRAGSLRSFPLPGGEAAIREPRRAALGLLYEIFGSGLFEEGKWIRVLTQWFSHGEINALRSMLERGFQCPRTSSAGRLFDAVSCLLGLETVNAFEGEAAALLEFQTLRQTGDVPVYPFEVKEQEGRVILDWQSLVEGMIKDQENGVPVPAIARGFHHSLAEMIVRVSKTSGLDRVALSGGCFQNRELTERTVQRLREEGLKPYWHQRIPPNDGGLALGQVMAVLRRRTYVSSSSR